MSSDSESSYSEVPEPRGGAIRGRRNRTEIIKMEPRYETPDGAMVSITSPMPKQKTPDQRPSRLAVHWPTDDEGEDTTEKGAERSREELLEYDSMMKETFDKMQAAIEQHNDSTNAIIDAQQQDTARMAQMTRSMALLLEELVDDVEEVKKSLAQGMDSGCYSSTTPLPSPTPTEAHQPHQPDVKPKQQNTPSQPRPMARPVRPPPGFEQQPKGLPPPLTPILNSDIDRSSHDLSGTSLDVIIGSPPDEHRRQKAAWQAESTPSSSRQPSDLQYRSENPAHIPTQPRTNPITRIRGNPPKIQIARPATSMGVGGQVTFADPLEGLQQESIRGSRGLGGAPEVEWGMGFSQEEEEVPYLPAGIMRRDPVTFNTPTPSWPGNQRGEAGGYRRPTRQVTTSHWVPIQEPHQRPYVGYRAEGRPKLLPSRFDGSGSWEDYLIQFETVSGVNGWTAEDRAHYLVASLDGEARGSLTTLCQQGVLGNYDAIIAALTQEYGNQMDLARAFRKLAGLAYPELTFHLQETLAMENFLEALDYETALAVHQAKCTTLADAARIATELEAFRLAERRKHQPRKFARMVAVNEPEVQDDKAEMAELLKELKEFLNRTEQAQKRDPRATWERNGAQQQQRGGSRYDRKQPGDRRDLSSVECWNCGQYGHYRNRCPEPRREHGSQETMSGEIAPSSGNC